MTKEESRGSKMKRYYAEYSCPNARTGWAKETDNIKELEAIAKSLSINQAMFIYDSEKDEIIFNKHAAEEKPRVNEIANSIKEEDNMEQYRKTAYSYKNDYYKQLQQLVEEMSEDIRDMAGTIGQIECNAEDEGRDLTKEEKLDCEEYRKVIADLEEAQDRIYNIMVEIR